MIISVCPIQLPCLLLISSLTGNWFVVSHSSLLLMVSGQRTLSIMHRQLFINTCTFLMMVVVVLQVSSPYSRNDNYEIVITKLEIFKKITNECICSSIINFEFFCRKSLNTICVHFVNFNQEVFPSKYGSVQQSIISTFSNLVD
ncbi:unnamed protein product [Schistosoma curassoni]|nr:unnamed protein product [Schistosoma curassoni]